MNQTEQILLLQVAMADVLKYSMEAKVAHIAKNALAATSSISPPAASETIDTPDFEALAVAYRETELVSDQYRALIAHINAWHAANKPAALAAQGDAVPVAWLIRINGVDAHLHFNKPGLDGANLPDGWTVHALAHPSPTPTPVTGEKVASIYGYDEMLGCAVDFEAVVRAQVAASKPAESGDVVDSTPSARAYRQEKGLAPLPQPAHPQGAAGLTHADRRRIASESGATVFHGYERLLFTLRDLEVYTDAIIATLKGEPQ